MTSLARDDILAVMERLGKYTLLRRLTTGGMAELYLARQSGPGGFEKMVAIKRLLPALSDDPAVMRMFINEARIAARLSHPNVVQIYDLGAVDRDYFIAMEYVNGRDLAEIQARAAETQQPPGYDIIVYIMQRVCCGLHHAHTLKDVTGKPLGLVHRDVSPENILISYGGEVKLVDFGIAKATAMAAESQAGLLKGKFAYMSPEQCRNEPLDARSDIFSVGVLLYELVCRRRLFRRQNELATMRAVLEDPIPPPSAVVDDVPDGLEQTIMRALARRVGQRFQSAAELQAALEEVADQEGLRAGPASAAEYLARLFPVREELERESDSVAQAEEQRIAREPTPDLVDELLGTEAGPAEALSIDGLDGVAVAATGDIGTEPTLAAPFRSGVEAAHATAPTEEIPMPGASPAGSVSFPAPSPPSAEQMRPQLPPVAPAVSAPASPAVPPFQPAGLASPLPQPAVPPRGRLVLYVLVPTLLVLAVAALLLSLKLRDSAREGYPVAVFSEPAGAFVYVDGTQHFGKTPLTVHGLNRDREHTLLLMLDGFLPWRQQLKLDGSPASRQVRVRLLPRGPGGDPGSLALQANVTGAEVYLDGEMQGTTPLVLDKVRAGEPHTLVVRKEGYQDEKVRLPAFQPGERRQLQIRLRSAEEAAAERPLRERPRKKTPPKKTIRSKSSGRAGVEAPRRVPSLQSPIEGRIGEHLPEAP